MANGNLLFTLGLFGVCSAILAYSFKNALAPIVSTATYRLQALIDPSLHEGRIILNDDEGHNGEAGPGNGGFDGNRYHYGDAIINNLTTPALPTMTSSSAFHTPDLERYPKD